MNPVPTKPDPPPFRLKQETGSTDFSTLEVIGPGTGLAAFVLDGAAVAAGADPTTVTVAA
jgi:hypothetical protein